MAIATTAAAERLPLRSFSIADGLPNNRVNRIVADSRGFLWFCTHEGLARFDGYGFINYGVDDGLPSAMVNDLIETRAGVYWVATGRGLVRFDPLAAPDRRFTTVLPNGDPRSQRVMALFEDRDGRIWVGTMRGAFVLGPNDYGAFRAVTIAEHPPEALAFTQDAHGTMWIGASNGLYRLLPRDRVERYAASDGLPQDFVSALLTDREGHLWVGTRTGGLARLSASAPSARAMIVARYGSADGLPALWINQIIQRADGGVWAATALGPAAVERVGDRYRARGYSATEGLPSALSIAEARDGALWIGTGAGVSRLQPDGFTIFDASDGIPAAGSLVELPGGDLGLLDVRSLSCRVGRFDGSRFVTATLPLSHAPSSWGWNQMLLIDHAGDWWFGTSRGAVRYRGIRTIADLERATPDAVYGKAQGLPTGIVLRLFEDSRGDVWMATAGEGDYNGVARWERRTNTLTPLGDKDGLPPLLSYFATSFAEARDGSVWIGFSSDGGLVRYRAGEVKRFTAAEGVPPSMIRNLTVDSRGRLWGASYGGGLVVTDDPTAARPAFSTYTTSRGLSSNVVLAVVEDSQGRMYVGTARALDRLDPASGAVRTFVIGGGPTASEMLSAVRTRTGDLWFGYQSGLVRLRESPEAPSTPPTILITSLAISGTLRSVFALGEPALRPFAVQAGSDLRVEFVSPGGTTEGLRYQHTLAGDRDWRPPSADRAVTFANLSPGTYRFAVRAIDADGVSSAPAGFAFTVLAPLWQRWWFVALAVGAIAVAANTLIRRRLARQLEIAQMRARIATDLHDDIGANLTRIAVLSEVVRQRQPHGTDDEPLASIAAVARESMSSMSDIVWAIGPGHDSLADLVRKMREYAGEVLADVHVTFDDPENERVGRLSVDVRREVYLVFKEAVNNTARHADASQVRVIVRLDGAGLTLEVEDNGVGFDAGVDADSTGLASMHKRADRLGGTLIIDSAPGVGTRLRLTVPVSRRRINLRN
jgi:ligand-binding sensor domain-containing protein/signal transduction histidine kinase